VTLKRATLLGLIGLSYTFALKTIGTFLPGIFTVASVRQAATVMSLIASLTLVVFYVVFRRDYLQKDQIALKRASAFAIIGSSAILVLRTKNLLLLSNAFVIVIYETSPFLFRLVRSSAPEALAAWISSILFLSFFVVFHKEVLHKKLTNLKRATLSGVIGSSIGALLLTVILLNSVYSGQLRWFHVTFRTSISLFLPFTALGFASLFYFFFIFYKEQTAKRGVRS